MIVYNDNRTGVVKEKLENFLSLFVRTFHGAIVLS